MVRQTRPQSPVNCANSALKAGLGLEKLRKMENTGNSSKSDDSDESGNSGESGHFSESGNFGEKFARLGAT